MNRLVVTGGAGFIGSHFVERLLTKGYDVLVLDNYLTGGAENLAPFQNHPKFSFLEQDVTQDIRVGGTVHGVLHFASPASPDDYLKYPIQTLKVGALGTHKALGFAKAKKAWFFLASTSEVYGDPLVHPQPESYWGNVNPIGPRGVYDEAKRFAEALALAYHRTHGVPVRIARIFNTFGPKMRLEDGRAIPNFISQAIQGKPLTVYGDGSQTRSFCYISDLVDGIEKLIESKLNEPVNLGNPQEMTVRALAEKIIALTGTTSTIEQRPLPQDDPRVRQPDIRKARAELGWEPRAKLEDGLRATIEYFRAKLAGRQAAATP